MKLPDSPNLRYGAEKARFQLLSDEQFDKSYVTAMIDDYTKDIQAFQDESGNGIDSDVKQFASKNLPIVREHLIMMKAIQGKTTAHNSFEAWESKAGAECANIQCIEPCPAFLAMKNDAR